MPFEFDHHSNIHKNLKWEFERINWFDKKPELNFHSSITWNKLCPKESVLQQFILTNNYGVKTQSSYSGVKMRMVFCEVDWNLSLNHPFDGGVHAFVCPISPLGTIHGIWTFTVSHCLEQCVHDTWDMPFNHYKSEKADINENFLALKPNWFDEWSIGRLTTNLHRWRW